MPGNTSFGGSDFSMGDAEEVDLESFLNEDPNSVQQITKEKKEEEDKDPKKKTDTTEEQG